MENRELENMPYKSVCNIALSPIEWINGLQIVKESIAIVSLLIAIGFTLYKWRQGWNGWNPKNRKQGK